jgi:hypothetical protein
MAIDLRDGVEARLASVTPAIERAMQPDITRGWNDSSSRAQVGCDGDYTPARLPPTRVVQILVPMTRREEALPDTSRQKWREAHLNVSSRSCLIKALTARQAPQRIDSRDGAEPGAPRGPRVPRRSPDADRAATRARRRPGRGLRPRRRRVVGGSGMAAGPGTGHVRAASTDEWPCPLICPEVGKASFLQRHRRKVALLT